MTWGDNRYVPSAEDIGRMQQATKRILGEQQ